MLKGQHRLHPQPEGFGPEQAGEDCGGLLQEAADTGKSKKNYGFSQKGFFKKIIQTGAIDEGDCCGGWKGFWGKGGRSGGGGQVRVYSCCQPMIAHKVCQQFLQKIKLALFDKNFCWNFFSATKCCILCRHNISRIFPLQQMCFRLRRILAQL